MSDKFAERAREFNEHHNECLCQKCKKLTRALEQAVLEARLEEFTTDSLNIFDTVYAKSRIKELRARLKEVKR